MPGEDFLTQLLTTPGGVLILVQSLIVALAVLMMAVSTVRQPKKTENGHSNGNGAAVAKDAMLMQQDYIENLQHTINKLFEDRQQIVASLTVLTTSVNAHMEHDTARRTLHEMNGLKIEQQSQQLEAVKKELEGFGQYNIRAVQSGAAREIQFANLVESVQAGQGIQIGLLQEIRDLLRGPNGTNPDAATQPEPGKILHADGAQAHATVESKVDAA